MYSLHTMFICIVYMDCLYKASFLYKYRSISISKTDIACINAKKKINYFLQRENIERRV